MGKEGGGREGWSFARLVRMGFETLEERVDGEVFIGCVISTRPLNILGDFRRSRSRKSPVRDVAGYMPIIPLFGDRSGKKKGRESDQGGGISSITPPKCSLPCQGVVPNTTPFRCYLLLLSLAARSLNI